MNVCQSPHPSTATNGTVKAPGVSLLAVKVISVAPVGNATMKLPDCADSPGTSTVAFVL
jgi:hypothetical protein